MKIEMEPRDNTVDLVHVQHFLNGDVERMHVAYAHLR